MSPLPPLADIRAATAPSVVILGNDAQLAARPATPVQLAHACLAAGFHAVVPASWGDELVAGATLAALRGRATQPAIHCACPHVARRILSAGPELAPHLVSLVAPPVAAARYLRLHSTAELRISYVGRCPAAADDSIDARLTPEELLAQLLDRDIDVTAQPEVFDSVIPPDRRRHLSLPGGLPSPEILWSRSRINLETMKAGDFASQLADLVLARSDALIDPAPVVGCTCAGAVRDVEPEAGRSSVVALEPPRSAHPVVDDGGDLRLELQLPALVRDIADLVGDGGTAQPIEPRRPLPVEPLGDAPPSPPPVPNRRPRLTPPGVAAVASAPPQSAIGGPPPRRRSPTGTPRVVPGAVPLSSDSEGRVLPRAYVARRRSPRSGIPVVTDPLSPSDPGSPGHATAPATSPKSAPRHTIPETSDEQARGSTGDSERPVARSVEPPVVSPPAPPAAPIEAQPAASASEAPARHAPASHAAAMRTQKPAAADRGPAVTTNASLASSAETAAIAASDPSRAVATAGAVTALLRQRSWLVVASAIAGTGLILGVAIGYAFAHRGATTGTTAAPSDRAEAGLPGSAQGSGVRESVSSGGIAPVPNAATSARRGPVRAAPRPVAGRQRTNSQPPPTNSRAAAAPTAPTQLPAAAAPVNPPAATPADSTRIQARRDSAARADSLAAEREALRREIAMRRARMDSIERARRRIDSLQRAQARPPDR
ncbi:MAG: [Fe-Fe] hydrogenase large subunit C-terminal domain-containing protein [Gemmatimonadaceae bacterium]